MRKRSRGGKRADLDNVYFRSSWEANWGRYLNFLISVGEIRSWDFEPEEFEFIGVKRGNRFYLPDFKVVNKDGTVEYHEIKGYMDASSRTKLKRMAKYYPHIKILLIDKAYYSAVAKKVGSWIPNWE